MRKNQPFQPGGLWLAISAAALWGTIGVATQAIYNADSTTSLFINLGRSVVATPVLFALCWRTVGRKMFRIPRRDVLIMVLSGMLLAISQAAYFAGIRAAGVTITTLLTICVAPVVVAALAILLKMERLTWQLVVALICALAGSVLLVSSQSAQDAQQNMALGTFWSLVAAVTYAAVILCGRFLAANYHPLQVTTIGFCGGSVLLLAINLTIGIIPVHSAQSWVLIVYLGLIPTALAYTLFQSGLRSISATAGSIVSMLEPVVAAILAWIMFHEQLGPLSIVGAGLLIVSMVLLANANGR
jgi:DME family drug/metabolite transporter